MSDLPPTPGRKNSWLDYAEPARLRAVWTAIVSLATVLGVTLGLDVDNAATAIIAVVAAVLPLLQGEWTRAAVVSPRTHDIAVKMAAGGMPPDVP